MSRHDRIVRYGAACAVMLIGVACGATISGTLGGTLATVLIAVGMLAFLRFLFGDMGLSDRSDRSRRPPAAPHSGDPRGTPRARARVGGARSPERMRGQRRRLR